MKEQNIDNINKTNDKNKKDEDRFSSQALLNAFISDCLKRKKNENINK